MLAALIALTSLAALCGMVAGYVSVRYRVDDDPVPARVDALLPQTQCGRCGFDGCRPYAEAIARGDAGIDRCPPGGEATIHALAGLLDREPVPLDPTCGDEGPEAAAVIDEANCIGCTICIRACPVDAIVGAAKQMHTVIEAECTGCGLCVEPCPVDCIDMVPLPATVEYWRWPPPAAITGGH